MLMLRLSSYTLRRPPALAIEDAVVRAGRAAVAAAACDRYAAAAVAGRVAAALPRPRRRWAPGRRRRRVAHSRSSGRATRARRWRRSSCEEGCDSHCDSGLQRRGAAEEAAGTNRAVSTGCASFAIRCMPLLVIHTCPCVPTWLILCHDGRHARHDVGGRHGAAVGPVGGGTVVRCGEVVRRRVSRESQSRSR